jgi:hypothetical protein
VIPITNPDPENKLGEHRDGSRFQELREAPFPRAAREFAGRTIDQTRDAYERCSRTLDAVVQILGTSFAAAGQGAAALRRNITDTVHGNLNLSFDLTKTLADATNFSVELQAAYWRKQFDAVSTQAEEVRHRMIEFGVANLKAAAASPEFVRNPVKKASPQAQEAPAVTEVGNTLEHEAPPAAAPKQSETRTKTKSGPQEEARERSLPAEIKYGVLDGNAVRFTSLEAWWLVDGVWRPISPDEVLFNAAVMREARYDQFFPDAPRLPSDAFKADKLQN